MAGLFGRGVQEDFFAEPPGAPYCLEHVQKFFFAGNYRFMAAMEWL